MIVADLIRELKKFAPDDMVEIFIENKYEYLIKATEVIRCPPRLGSIHFPDSHRTVWIK